MLVIIYIMQKIATKKKQKKNNVITIIIVDVVVAHLWFVTIKVANDHVIFIIYRNTFIGCC